VGWLVAGWSLSSSPLSFLVESRSERPAAVKGAPKRRGEATLDGEDRSETITRGRKELVSYPLHPLEILNSLFPGQFAHPACQKEHVSFAEWVLAIGPGTSSTTRRRFCSGPGACGRGEKPRSPNGDELERTLSELIVAGRWSATTGGDGFGTYTWPYPDLEAACHLR